MLGAGPIGLGVIQCLKARGATTIIVAEVAKERQNFAKLFGATHIFDPRSDDVVKKSKEVCEGQGPNMAFDCAGVAASIKTAALAIRSRGCYIPQNALILKLSVIRNCRQRGDLGEGSAISTQ